MSLIKNIKKGRLRTLVVPVLFVSQTTLAIESNQQNIQQPQLNQLADILDVKYRLLSNLPAECPGSEAEFCYHAQLELTSPLDMKVKGWKILYSQVYPPTETKSQQLKMTHLNGDLNVIEPNPQFSGFLAGQSKTLEMWVPSSLLNEGELLPNYILMADGLAPKVIKSTQTFIDPITKLEVKPYAALSAESNVMNSHRDDHYAQHTPEALYEQYLVEQVAQTKIAAGIIPTPQQLQTLPGQSPISLAAGIKLELHGLDYDQISASLARLDTLGVSQQAQGVPVKVEVKKAGSAQAGHYQLTANNGKVNILADDASGAFYALQSLAALLSLDTMSIPAVKIDDQPRYDYRGLHVDVARNFHSKEFILRLLPTMAAYKLNKLHLHLADDEGWRLEIPGLPELTELGANRCLDLQDARCLQPQLGAAIDNARDGYYSLADYHEILLAAKANHIDVIPSLDMPGHSRAAVKAMESRYNNFMAQNDSAAAKQYLLSDLADKTQYSSIQHYKDNTLNVCMESTYAFVDKVITEIVAMHKAAGTPLNIYHIGADETAGAWVNSPLCQSFLADKRNDVHAVSELTGYFIERVAKIVASKGVEVAGWNDGLSETRVDKMPKKVASYVWATLPQGAHKVVSAHARRGWDVILSTPDVTYLDFPYELDPKESGYKWGSRRTNSQTIFQFMPDNLPANAEIRGDVIGRPYSADDTPQYDESGKLVHQPLPQGFRVTGIQGHLWSEVVRHDHLAEYMLFPRLLALAEKAWHTASWEVPYNYAGQKYDQTTQFLTVAKRTERDSQWQEFVQIVGNKELEKLDRTGVFYRVPNVVSKQQNGYLHATTIIPGLAIQYRQGDEPWQYYQAPLKLNADTQLELRALSADGRRPGRSVQVATSTVLEATNTANGAKQLR
ncbi:family 20 glycosylhydrolase [Pseudoalteromonas fenneropenaei]|uniref:beta-N-acetylhexosaminidase n=1 Tax=Pseudoalteromonas fenneropenaei TaxID=1737459 RepID=A0ABV7CK27_9GAMM